MNDKQIVRLEAPMRLEVLMSFGLYHTYRQMMGWLSIVMGVAIEIAGAALYLTGKSPVSTWILMGALGFSVIGSTAFQIYVDAKSQMRKNGTFKKPIMYVFSNKGISAIQNKDKREFGWQEIRKIVSTKKAIGIYYSRERAMVIPKDIFDSKAEQIMPLINANLEPSEIKL